MRPPREIALIFDLDNTLIHSTIDFIGTRHRLIDLLEAAGRAPAPREQLVREPIPHLVALGEAVDADLARAMWDVIATRTDVRALKPSPEGVRYILEHLPGVEVAYVVGDAWIDGRAAEDAGARFIGFGPREDASRERGVRPWAWIADLRELLSLPLGQT